MDLNYTRLVLSPIFIVIVHAFLKDLERESVRLLIIIFAKPRKIVANNNQAHILSVIFSRNQL